jgi:hypothetical protein
MPRAKLDAYQAHRYTLMKLIFFNLTQNISLSVECVINCLASPTYKRNNTAEGMSKAFQDCEVLRVILSNMCAI